MLVSLAIVAMLASGAWRCPTATLFHVPCPACGSTRAMLALFHGDFKGVLLNPLAPVTSLIFGLMMARAIYLELVEGHLQKLGEGFGAWLTRALLVVALLETAIWAFRWFGFFGGPVPV